MSIHSVTRSQFHLAWDNSIQPILRVQSGDTVKFDCLDASNGQITPDSTAATLTSLALSSLDQVNGPIFVEGALPGDTLQVEILSIETADWGWTACIPGFGLLSDEFPEPVLKIWKLNKDKGFAYFDEEKGIKIPLKPFAGEMGHVTAGSTLYLPVEVEGALFSMGDGHAAQGDGEVCGTAIETPIVAELRLSVLKNRPYTKTPHFQTSIHILNETYYCTTGVEPNLQDATRAALRHMIQYLGAEYGLNPVEAYMLCSVAGDLRMLEVVDMPNYLVGMMMPRSIFPNAGTSA
ncbi:Formamidase [Rhodocollybia butyracea]|uniref:Formamidase n=1 Tax=Rhodocollybia butyracea TaxID=206335 RepID=A0A9P5PGA2_9AGAR|nr:Formamidase [Rhodocollybia butyracea]